MREIRLAATGPRLCCQRRARGKAPLALSLADAIARAGWTREKLRPDAQGYVLRDERGELVRPDRHGQPRHLTSFEALDALVHAGHEVA